MLAFIVCPGSVGWQAEVMLQHDGNAGNKCTCFMYLQPTDLAKELLVLWKQSILDSDAFEDQVSNTNNSLSLASRTYCWSGI